MFDDERSTRITTDDDSRVERHPAQEGQPELLRGVLASADLEDVRLLSAMRAHEAAHVLDYAEDVHLDGLREGDRLSHIEEGYLLGRRDDDRAVRVGDFLGDAEGLVAGSRRKIDYQVVQVSPLDVGEHLLESLDLERTTPDDRRVAVDQLSH